MTVPPTLKTNSHKNFHKGAVMHTFLIGQILEVRPISRTNKSTGELISTIDVTIQSILQDKDNFNVINTEVVSYPFNMRPKFDAIKGKYIAIPYKYSSYKDSSYFFPDANLNFVIFDSDPFLEKAKDKRG